MNGNNKPETTVKCVYVCIQIASTVHVPFERMNNAFFFDVETHTTHTYIDASHTSISVTPSTVVAVAVDICNLESKCETREKKFDSRRNTYTFTTHTQIGDAETK